MSTPSQGAPAPGPGPEQEKRVSRMLSRMRSVFRRGDGPRPEGSKRLSFLGALRSTPATAVAPAAAAAGPSSAPAPEPAPADPYPDAEKVPRSQIYELRARKLAERFGIDIKPNEWYSMEGHALRVEKPIRMRVHHKCHSCDAAFGASRQCPSCQHVLCGQCTRVPPARTEAERQASKARRAERAENPPIAPEWYPSSAPITREGKQPDQQLVYKPVRLRVRRNCCQCEKLFVHEKSCQGCGHIRCTDCPRNPAKKEKYPFGYPGDAFGANAVPHQECHQCRKAWFPSDAEDGTPCSYCKHGKCPDCPRMQPRKVEPQLDPDILRRLEAKIADLTLE